MHSLHKLTLTEKVADKLFKLSRKIITPKPLINFFVVGTAKGGTTALHAFLEKHPEICMPYTKKELHFFDNDRFFRNLNSFIPPYRNYHSNYRPTTKTKIVGEACPTYMWNEKAPERIYEYNPSSKIIVLLRNPIYRAHSHWNMAIEKANDHASFLVAISSELDRLRVSKPNDRIKSFTSYQNNFSYIDKGYYASQIRRLLRFFPQENILILLSEDLQERHDETLSEIFSFLEVDEKFKVEKKTVHKREYKASLTNEEQEKLRTIFEPEIRSLELLINRDLSHWIK